MKQETEHPGKDGTPREPFVAKLKAAGVILLLFLVPALLYHVFTRYMYDCTIPLPAGKTVVGSSDVRARSPLGEYLYGSSVVNSVCPWIKPYLGYRHYVIPDGATEIDIQAFYWSGVRESLRTVRIPDSVKTIGDQAFGECGGLRDVVLPEGVEFIAGGAFHDTGLTRIRIPDSVKILENCIFSACTDLRRVDIPDSVLFIGECTFAGCTELEEVRLPAGMTRSWTEEEWNAERARLHISYNAISDQNLRGTPRPVVHTMMFDGCANLKKVVIPDGIREIGAAAFSGCANLSEINLPDSVTKIWNRAFLGCRSLPPLMIGRQLVTVEAGAFTGTGCRLTVPDDHPSLRFENGILYSKDAHKFDKLISCVAAPKGRCVVRGGVYSIEDFAFYGCAELTDITLPDSLWSIGENAFSGCTALTHVELPDFLYDIGTGAFFGCTALTHVELPDDLREIGRGAFSGCAALTEIAIPDSVWSIGNNAFRNCTGLRRVTLPSGLESIQPETFRGCTSLEEITIP
ncbi:MAG: leucine-rich repeat domain-containing protein, partial [Lentisphaeria bacterium]|nr:leucine-rich repeat domain-containing protein [Lentisphaeria bacterium]